MNYAEYFGASANDLQTGLEISALQLTIMHYHTAILLGAGAGAVLGGIGVKKQRVLGAGAGALLGIGLAAVVTRLFLEPKLQTQLTS
jgi:hypothetical protein